MYIFVDSEEKNEIFEEKWKKICDEKGFKYISCPYELFAIFGITRYLIVDSNGDYIGTVEFVKFSPGGYSIINQYYDFHEQFKTDVEDTYEVGKLSIDFEKRNEGHLEKTLMTLKDFAFENKIKRYLATIEGELFRIIERVGISLNQLNEEMVHNNFSLINTEIDVSALIQDFENCRILKRMLARTI